MSKKKVSGIDMRSSQKLSRGSTFKSEVKEISNELEVTLNYLKPNLVQWNKEVIWELAWMEANQHSEIIKIKTTADHIVGGIIELENLKFTFLVDSILSVHYLTKVINNPIVITMYDASHTTSHGKSNSKLTKNTGEMLGQACLDLLPLFTQTLEPEKDISKTSAFLEDSAKSVEDVKSNRVINDNDRVIETELVLEQKNTGHGAELSTPMNKMGVSVTATLHIHSSLPDGFNHPNILTITVESVYNLPPPLNKTEASSTDLEYSLGITLPVLSVRPQASRESAKSNKSSTGKSSTTHEETEPRNEDQIMTVVFKGGELSAHPDVAYRSKWKTLDSVTGRAQFTTGQLSKHLDDVKYSEAIEQGVQEKNHIQFNQLYRIWLTSATEQMVREHIETYGLWPLELQISGPEATVTPKKHDKDDKKSTGGKSQGISRTSQLHGRSILDQMDLPMKLLAMIDMTDLLQPALTTTRVLGEFLPLPTSAMLHAKTGFDEFVFVKPSHSTDTGLKTSQDEAQADKNEHQSKHLSKPSTESKMDKNPNDGSSLRFHSNPFCVVVNIELSRALSENPETKKTLQDLNEIVASQNLYFPDFSRMKTESIRNALESGIAKCTEIFYAEFEDFEKLKKKNFNVNAEKTKRKIPLRKEVKRHTGESDEISGGEADEQEIETQTPTKSSLNQTKSSTNVKLLIRNDFRKYISQSGALSKCYFLLERPLREFILFNYIPDEDIYGRSSRKTAEGYSIEKLSDIHAALMGVMSQVVERISCNTTPRTGSAGKNETGNCDIGGITALLRQDSSTTASCISRLVRFAREYTAQGFTSDARRLFLSRIHSAQRVHSSSGVAWTDFGRWCLRHNRLEEARESLRQSLYLGVGRDALMMSGYVSFRLKEWEKSEFYFTALSYLFDQSMEVWMTLHVYYLNIGKSREASTALHMARLCLARIGHTDEKDEMSETESYKHPNVCMETESDNLSEIMMDELVWTIPTPACFGDEKSDTNVYMRVCPLLLALNMFEFADTCIGEYLLGQPTPSPVATYYRAVGLYKQRQYLSSMSYLNTVATPLNKCTPIQVLKFHNAYSLYTSHIEANTRENNANNQQGNTKNLKSKSDPNTKRIVSTARTTQDISDPSTQKEPNTNVSNERKISSQEMSGPSEETQQKTQKSTLNKIQNNSVERLSNGSLPEPAPSMAECRRFYASMRWEMESYRELKYLVLLRLAKISIDAETSDVDDMSEAEQILLGLTKEYNSPLIWYYLGCLYLKQNKVRESELAFNESNKLDPAFGNPWAGLAMVQFAQRHPALFLTCYNQAKKYGAEPVLLETLDKIKPFLAQ